MAFLGAILVVVVGLLAAAVIPYVQNQRRESALAATKLDDIGVSSSAAGCDPILTKKTDMSQDHIPAPTPIPYTDAPPSFGPHRPSPAPFERKFYTAQDRPEVATLVHNLEHGYTILWYDDAIANDAKELQAIEAIAKKMGDERFLAAPWTKEDGKAFPSGKQIALTRWTAAASDPSDENLQRGNWQYCGAVSGDVVGKFVAKWPNAESPEPGIQ
ncbi:MAG: hypothetical protein JWR85_3226 [Marmoricola sp.]|nr:hypothetical protein [Marmoricola sp.]